MKLKFMLASQFHKSNKLIEAEKLYKEIIAKQPKDKRAMYYLASLYNLRKQSKESFELYKKLMAIDPNYLNTKKYYEMMKPKFEQEIKK